MLPPNHPDPTCPPRFALVLGSGGVRSIAALGMVEVLAREGLVPDLVVGCSAGAMFGALIAAGHDAGEAIRVATTLWSSEVTRKRRWKAVPQMLWPQLGRFDADFSLRDDGPSRMLAQVTSALTNDLMQARLAEAHGGGARLLSIVPRLDRRVGLFDTEAMPYLVEAGRRATHAALPNILALLQRAPQLAAA
jgi:hypothetical protein